MAKAIIEGGGEPGAWKPSSWQTGAQKSLQDLQSEVNKLNFVPAGSIVNQYGEKVQVDRSGRDVGGNIVVAAETPDDTAARKKADLAAAGTSTNNDTRTPVGTVNGVTYYDELAYATALADYNAGLRENNAIAAQKLADEAARKKLQTSAKASLESWLKTFFDPSKDSTTISQLMSFIDQQVTSDIPEDAIMINIRQQPFYQARFKGNEGLRKAGMAELDPSEYLRAEKSYADVLMAANLEGLSRRDIFADLIGGQVSSIELQDRVMNAYQRIKNADTALQEEMKRLGQLGNITSADYAQALLTGKEGAASLKRKIAQAEVSTEFTARNLTSAMGIEELANLGVTRQQAMQGAEYAKMGTKRLQDLATIYGVQSAEMQKELELEAFKGLESQRRKQLVAQEQAAFAGSSGTGTPSLGRSAAGAI